MRINLKWLGSILGACTALAVLHAAEPAKHAGKPNIVFFLIDDLGWRDLGCCGSTFYQTPSIDRLATEGVRFTDAYASAPLCSPTRASILTGKSPARLHLTYILGGQAQPNTKLQPPAWTQHLPLEEVTFAEALKQGGYATAQFGKWHVGDAQFSPENQGFDVAVPAEPAKNRHDKNVDQLTDAAIEFIRSHAAGPFLAYLCHHTVHVPLEADKAKSDAYQKVAPPTGQNHPIMAAMIESLDQSVGRVLRTLNELGIAHNTVVIFTSDNGGLRLVQEGKRVVTATDNSPSRAGKATLYEGGTRVPLLIKWPGVAQPGATSSVPVISSDLYPTLLDLAGLPARPSQHQDGLSLSPLLKGDGSLGREALFWHFPHYHSGTKPGGSVRAGDWKLIEFFEDNRVELYNLKDDTGESTNLAAKMPEKATALRKMLHHWRAAVDAQMPTPNLKFVAPPTPPPPDARGPLWVVNGDFSDLAGMTKGQDAWYAGLPKGWLGSSGTFALHAKRGATPPTCNPSNLGFFRQHVGVLDKASDVTLTFDVSEPWKPDVLLNASILDANLTEIAAGDFKAGARQKLVARSVPAGTAILIAFQAAKSTPGLDNLSVSAVASSAPALPAAKAEGKITVASYYFGNYHPGDPRNVKSKGKDWSEWELVRNAQPRFPGHHQPNVPLWGYADESDPKAMEQKIAAAADHGVDAFIFDWYYYDDGPFLDRPIDQGFLKASNNNRIQFAFMWANHDWIELHPYKKGAPRTILYPGKVSPANFENICNHVIHDYFKHPSYWKVDGKPYFSFYDLTRLLENFGSVEATRAGLDKFRAKVKAAGFPGLHLNAVAWGRPILPNEKVPVDSAKLVRDLGFDSVTSYVWIHHAQLPQQSTDYNVVRDAYFAYWNRALKLFNVPYYPNVSMGWDPSPRCDQNDKFDNSGYPFTNTIAGNTPERFQEALAMAKRRLLAKPGGPRILNINCWNEWTEGSYLEPDQRNGMKYLEAVREVFGVAPAAK